MDLSQLTNEDLQAITSGDMSKVSEAGLRSLSGAPAASAAKPESSRGVSDFALGAAQTAGAGIVNAIPAGINAASDIVHRWGGNDTSAPLVGNIVKPGQAAQRLSHGFTNAPHLSIDELRAFQEPGDEKLTDDQLRQKFEQVYNNGSVTNDVLPQEGTVAGDLSRGALKVGGDVANIAGGVGVAKAALNLPGQVANAARGVRTAVSGEGFSVPEETTPEDIGLKKPNNPPLTPQQQIGNTVAGAEAGVKNPKEAFSFDELKAGRAAPSAVVKRAVDATPDGPVDKQTLDEIDNAGGSGVPVSGQGSIQNIQGLRGNLKAILSSPDLTSQQKFDWMQALRSKGYKNIGSQDVGAQELGEAQLDAAKALEGHIERNIPPDADVDIGQFRDARTALAKNHTVESVMQGNNVDMAALGRIYQRNPNLLTGGLKMLGKYAAENQEATGLGSRFQPPIDLSKVDLTKPATWFSPVTGAASRVAANRAAAAGTDTAATAFQQNPARFNPIDRTPQPPPGMTASPPTAPPPAPAGRPGDIPLADLLSHGVEQSPPAGLSAGPMGAPAPQGIPFTRNAAHEAGGLELALEGKGEPSLADTLADLRDYAAVKSQGVPEGTMARTSPGRVVADTVDYPSGAPRRRIVETGNGVSLQDEAGKQIGSITTKPGPMDGQVQISDSKVESAAQGKGNGLAMYKQLVDSLHGQGKVLVSDTRVSAPAQKMYAALKKAGYNVVRNPAAKQGSGELVSYGDRPVFEVHPMALADEFSQ